MIFSLVFAFSECHLSSSYCCSDCVIDDCSDDYNPSALSCGNNYGCSRIASEKGYQKNCLAGVTCNYNNKGKIARNLLGGFDFDSNEFEMFENWPTKKVKNKRSIYANSWLLRKRKDL